MDSSGTLLDRPVVDELAGACDTLASADTSAVWRLGDGDVETGLSLLVRLQSRVTAVQAVLLAEAESRDLKARTGAPSTERWMADRLHLSRADGGARLRQSVALRRHPMVLDALAAGTITVGQGEVLGAVMHQVAGLPGLTDGEIDAAAEFLLDQCSQLGPRELGRAGQAVIETLTRTPSLDDPADAAAVQREHDRAEHDLQEAERNWLTVRHRPGGRARISADLGPVGTAGFLDWCRRHSDQPASGEDGFDDTRTRSERRGDALADLFTAGTTPAIGNNTSDAADAELEMDPGADADLDADDGELPDDAETQVGMPRPAGSRGGVVLTVITTLADLRAGIPAAGHLDTGAPLSAAALRQLACDAQVVPIVLNGRSQVLDLGRCSRPFNRAQRRAAAVRDRGCVAPGCDVPPAACHLHHGWWWSRGGPTDLDNAALLCGYHHRMVHRQDWAITLAANGYPQLHPPPAIDPTGRPRQHHRFTIDQRLRPATATSGRDVSVKVQPHPRT